MKLPKSCFWPYIKVYMFFAGIYLTFVMAMTTVSVIMTVIVLNFFYRGPNLTEVPPWAKRWATHVEFFSPICATYWVALCNWKRNSSEYFFSAKLNSKEILRAMQYLEFILDLQSTASASASVSILYLYQLSLTDWQRET